MTLTKLLEPCLKQEIFSTGRQYNSYNYNITEVPFIFIYIHGNLEEVIVCKNLSKNVHMIKWTRG